CARDPFGYTKSNRFDVW
nr:immunoglobulin heavy chain junction region [Macaca mulatta]MOV39954.1 immunoglobulin heavy chain junction region [Macaca mulatta]MOV40992.1 immunoglobulin heavy chain junction region [Macaca mulatta]MOV41019.1 immunoglobulin heavy chain junction region [Macaca mulatta]MOV41483.1 immunoglobulin heavy chain junction region [Macaca mulatta]